MKFASAVLALPLLTACVSIDLPGVVTDTAKVAKDAYKSATRKKDEVSANSVSNTYIGQDDQTAADVKKLCVNEAAAKLFKANGKEVPYTVTENTISTVNETLAAHCRIVTGKPEKP